MAVSRVFRERRNARHTTNWALSCAAQWSYGCSIFATENRVPGLLRLPTAGSHLFSEFVVRLLLSLTLFVRGGTRVTSFRNVSCCCLIHSRIKRGR